MRDIFPPRALNVRALSSLNQVRTAARLQYILALTDRGALGRYSAGYRLPGTLDTFQQLWMLGEAQVLHNGTQGKFDLVVWNTRGSSKRAHLTT